MQVTDEVNWTLADFVFAGALVAGVGAIFEVVAKTTSNLAYRAAVAIALAAGFFLIWLNGAVGIIGSEDNPANLMFGGVLAVAIAGAVLARFQPGGMARAMIAAAAAQMLVAVIALVAGTGLPASGPLEVLSPSAGFAVLWLTAAWLFRRTMRAGNSASAAQWPSERSDSAGAAVGLCPAARRTRTIFGRADRRLGATGRPLLRSAVGRRLGI
jgi:hypothetical protein